MININLSPGSGPKKKAPRKQAVDVSSLTTGFSFRLRDKFMLGSIAAVVISAGAVGFLFTTQTARESDLNTRREAAVADSTRYANFLKDRYHAESVRDTLLRQVNIIKSLDEDRFVWPHILDEISRVLPPYVWLRSLNQTSPISSEPPEVQAGISKPAPKKAEPGATAPAADSVLTFQLVGNTVDIQALTRFMKSLEASPFFKNVTLVRSDVLMQQGKEATEFRLDLQYEKPDPKILRTVPYTVSVR